MNMKTLEPGRNEAQEARKNDEITTETGRQNPNRQATTDEQNESGRRQEASQWDRDDQA